MNKVLYQDGKWDQFYYQYKYDDDNRLVAAYSDRYNDALLSYWTKDAGYIYYHHGPLARMELGGGRVQGMDYAYTLQGWLKGGNGQQLATAAGTPTDIGGDGNAGSVYSGFQRDVMGYSLGYYSGDYQPIGGSSASAFGSLYSKPSDPATSGQDLFNGNIGSSTYALDAFELQGVTSGLSGFSGYSYRYDQLNRMTGMDKHTINPYSTAAAWDNSSITTDYQERVSYDGNGNIITYNRNGRVVPVRGNSMDQLSYNYNRDANGNLVNNKLRHVIDAVTSASPAGDPVDIGSQPVDNYTYDAIGNLMHDQTQNLQRLNWTVYGKMASIGKVDGSSLGYGYDAGGNRITKTVKAADGSTTATHYVRDAQGNVLAVYQYKATAGGVATEGDWLEQHLYGSSRLGMLQPHVVILSGSKLGSDGYSGDNDHTQDQGNRLYELTNHLGNVLVTISDGLNPAGVTPNPNVVSAQDYYPFGMQMPGRTYIAGSSLSYRYGFNGKENDNEVEGVGNQIDYGMRVYDPRVGRFLSVDPLAKKYPYLTPYQYASNSPILNIDIDGLEGRSFWSEFANDPISAIYHFGWSDANEVAGTINNTIPATAAVNGAYQAASGKDAVYGQPASRIDGVANVVIGGILHYSVGRVAIPAIQGSTLEEQMAFNAKNSPETPGSVPDNTTGQSFSSKPSSKTLSKNLKASGIKQPANTAAHHIVAGTDPRAAPARTVLKREGIDINEADNGVYLPKNKKFAQPPAQTHSTVHTDVMYDNVNSRLINTPSGQVRQELNNIMNELLIGVFPIK